MPSLVVTNTRILRWNCRNSYTATAAAGNTTVNTMEAVGTDWDTIRMNSTDGAPATDAGDRIILEDRYSTLAMETQTHLQMETQTTGTTDEFLLYHCWF